jgi:hypothetical protein
VTMHKRPIALGLTVVWCAAISAAGHDEPWFNVPGGTWLPSEADVTMMKSDFDLTPPMFMREVDISLAPSRYWFRYSGGNNAREHSIELTARQFPIPSDLAHTLSHPLAAETTTGEMCEIHAEYVPSSRRFAAFSAGGFRCPPRM